MKKNDEHLVSVIIPIYKVEKYLDKCVQSVVNQTYQNLEIILVDDGSPDNCPKMCDDWSKKDKRIKVIHKKNGGVALACFDGISLSKGNEICFLDSDDYYEKNYIQLLLEAKIKENAQVAICNIRSVDLDGKFIENYVESKKYRVYEKTQKFNCVELLNKQHPCRWNKMIDKDLIIKCLTFLDTSISMGEDVNLIYCVLSLSDKVVCIPNVLTNYRILTNSLSRIKKDNSENYVKLIRQLDKFNKINSISHHTTFNKIINRFCNEILSFYIRNYGENGLKKFKSNPFIYSYFIKTRKTSFKSYIKFFLVKFNCYSLLRLFIKG